MPSLLLILALAGPSAGWPGARIPNLPTQILDAGAARDLPERAYALSEGFLGSESAKRLSEQGRALADLIHGMSAYRLGRFREAAAALDRVEGLIIEDYARFFEAEALFHAGAYKRAERRYRRLIDKHPTSFWRHRARFRVADALHGQGKGYAAQKALREALELYPEYPHPVAARMTLAQIERQRGRPRAAVEPLLEISEIWPAEAAEAESQLKALALQGVRVKPPPPQERYMRAKELRRRKYWPRAIELFEEIIADKKSDGGLRRRARLQMGRAYLQMERLEEAREIFSELAKETKGSTRRSALMWESRTLSRMGRVDEAVAALKAREKDPEERPSADLKEQLGELYFDHGRYEEARPFMERSGLWRRSWLAYRLGEHKDALEGFRRLRRNSRSNAKRYAYWEARTLARMGRVEEAVATYRYIRQFFPSSYYALQARSRLWELGREAPRRRSKPFIEGTRADPVEALARIARRWGGGLIFAHAAYEAMAIGERTLAMIYLRSARDEKRQRGAAYRPKPFVDNRKPDKQRGEWGRELRDKPTRRGSKIRRFLRSRTPEGLSSALRAGFDALDDQHYVRRMRRPGERPQGAVDESPLWPFYYPRPYRDAIEREAARQGIDPLLVWAFMTVESTYNPRAISRASARGLMQVMPHTGALITERMGLLNFGTPLLFEPEHTIPMAAWYIRQLLTKFRGEHLLAMAGYNAGPHRVAAWLDAKPKSIYLDEFVEEIPYNEAREYCKKVLRHYALYQRIYRGADDLNVKLRFDHGYEGNINF